MLDKTVKAVLILENGIRFEGKAFGHIKEVVGEVVFTTGMTGYQEAITDPSFAGQIVTFTYPLIGNYGINLEDMESKMPRLKGLIVREKCDYPNNWRCEMDLDGFLKQNKVMGLEGIDTRALTKVLRNHGTMKGIITTRVDSLSQSQINQNFESYSNKNVVREVTTKEKYKVGGTGKHVGLLDFGVKSGIIKGLQSKDFNITVFPAYTTAEEILAENVDALFLSNGPGDPKSLPEVIETIKGLIGKKPLVGICLGHQLISLALGGDTTKLKFGHHGGNHPVKDLKTGKIYITSQNHEYVVSNLPDEVEAVFTNVNDGTIEGIAHKNLPIYSVQFHPEAAPGPTDTEFLFDKFLKIIEGGKTNA